MVQHSVAQCTAVLCGLLWCSMMLHSVPRHGMAPHRCQEPCGQPIPCLGSRCPAPSSSPAWRDPTAPKAMPHCPQTGSTSAHRPWAPGVRGVVGGCRSQGAGGDLGWSRVPSLLKIHQEGAGVSWVVTPNLSPYRGAAGPELQLQLQPGEVQQQRYRVGWGGMGKGPGWGREGMEIGMGSGKDRSGMGKGWGRDRGGMGKG